jgi:aspartate aminotransferase
VPASQSSVLKLVRKADREAHWARGVLDTLPASIAELVEGRADDPRVISLCYGEADTPTPSFISDVAVDALRAGHTFYVERRGIPQLREAIATYQTRLRARAITADRISVTSGGMGAIMLALQALIDPGDNVVVLDPIWPSIKAAARILCGDVRTVSLQALPDGTWQLDPERIFAVCDRRTRAVIINTPSNPTGWTIRRPEEEELLRFVRRRGLWLISDEVYERLVYDGKPAALSLLDLCDPDDRVLVVNSFSKIWAMSGWRLGWLTAPRALNPVLDKLIEFNTISATGFLQYAAVTAVLHGETFVHAMRARCRAGRQIACERLSRLSRVRAPLPAGTFYVFFAVDGLSDSLAFAHDVLARHQVGLAPGIAFGSTGEGFMRACIAKTSERLHAAFDRLERALQ